MKPHTHTEVVVASLSGKINLVMDGSKGSADRAHMDLNGMEIRAEGGIIIH